MYVAVVQKCNKVENKNLIQMNSYINRLEVGLNSFCVVPIEELKCMCVFFDFDDVTYYAKKVINVDLE